MVGFPPQILTLCRLSLEETCTSTQSVTAVVVGKLARAHLPSDRSTLDLSDRETEVLQLIAQGHSNKEIAGRLKSSVKTVETYKARSMETLGLKGRADIVRFAVQKGWLQDNRRMR